MTIVRLGRVILQEPQASNRWEYRADLRQQIGLIMLYVVERCITEALEARVTQVLGRQPYQRCREAAFGPSEARCGRCRSRDRRRFRRNGHYGRYLDTAWGRVRIPMPQVICRCGGAVQVPFRALGRCERIWDDLRAQIRACSGQGLSLRQIKAQLDASLHSSVGLRQLNEAIQAVAHLVPQAGQVRRDVPPVVRLDGLWIKRMEPTGQERIDRLGRKRAVKTGASCPILVAQGVWPDTGRQEILAWQLENDEGLESWQRLFETLFDQGIRPHRGLRLLIGDGSPGLQAAWQANYWEVPFQRCIFHKLRNVRRKLHAPEKATARQARGFRRRQLHRVSAIWQADCEQDARLVFRDLAGPWRHSQPQALATLERDFEHTLTFYEAQRQAQRAGSHWPARALRTTSPLERAFRSDRRRLRPSVLFHSYSGWLAVYTQIQLRKNARRQGLLLDQHQHDLELRLAIS